LKSNTEGKKVKDQVFQTEKIYQTKQSKYRSSLDRISLSLKLRAKRKPNRMALQSS